MFCKSCGNELNDKAKFCPKCGINIHNPESAAEAGRAAEKPPVKPNSSLAVIITAAVVVLVVVAAYGLHLLTGSGDTGTEEAPAVTELIEDNAESDDDTNLNEVEAAEIQDTIDALLAEGIGGGYDAEKAAVSEYAEQASELLSKGDLAGARDTIAEWQLLIETISMGNTYDLSVSQIDAGDFPTIRLYLMALDPTDGTAADLDINKFIISENDAGNYIHRTILRALRLDQSEQIGMCMTADISGSMSGYFDEVKNAMKGFLSSVQSGGGDNVSLVTFDDNISINLDFTTDYQALGYSIDAMTTGNMTALYDALYVSVSMTAAQNGAKCVVAFTDGQDNSSVRSPEDVISLAQKLKIPVFIIGIGDDIDTTTLTSIASVSGGFYRNVYSGISIEDIYKEIYVQQKQMYMLEYETDQSTPETAARSVYIAYNDGASAMRGEISYTPSILAEQPDDYVGLLNRSSLPNDQIEDEILRIRALWNTDRAAIADKSYVAKAVMPGVTAYSDNGQVKMIEVTKNTDGFGYSRIYEYENGGLIFAYIESGDAHRLYFKNDSLFRWRYTVDAQKRDEAVNHDNEGDSQAFKDWQQFALDEGYRLYVEASK